MPWVVEICTNQGLRWLEYDLGIRRWILTEIKDLAHRFEAEILAKCVLEVWLSESNIADLILLGAKVNCISGYTISV